jgi:hypothetical protein
MMYIKITNKGLLDIRLFSLMGGTTKSDDAVKIGQWGTGLKYSITSLLKRKNNFHILLGGERVDIVTKTEQIRDTDFNVVYVNGEKTSLTTSMGGNAWGEWECIREIYSNALDEGGATLEIVSEVSCNKDETAFFIEATPEFLSIYNNIDRYFINKKVPMYENERFKLYPNSGNLAIYKQGVFLQEVDKKSLFLYDFKDAEINELREYKGHLAYDLAGIIYSIDDTKVIRYIIENINEDFYEGKIDFKLWRSSTWQKPNNAWTEAFGNAKIITQEIKNKCEGKQVGIDLTHTVVVPENLYKGLNHHIEGISALRLADKVNEFYEIYDQELEFKLKQALTILEECDYWIHPEASFIFGEFGKGETLARVDLDKKEIMISQKLKDKSMFDFCSMLIEENEHLRTGFSDETRQFQQHFIDLYTKSIMDKAGVKL